MQSLDPSDWVILPNNSWMDHLDWMFKIVLLGNNIFDSYKINN